MPAIHPLYEYGPYAFLGVSAVFSATVGPRLHRRLLARRAARHDRRGVFGPTTTLRRPADGERVVVAGTLEGANRGPDRYLDMAVEQSPEEPYARMLVEELSLVVDGRRVPLAGDVEISLGSELVRTSGPVLSRLYLGDRVHVSGVARLGEAERASYRTSARAVRLASTGERPLRLAYAGVPPLSRPGLVHLATLLAVLVGFWLVGSALGALVLVSALASEPADDAPLLGSTVDRFVLAHAAPPLSALTTRLMVERLSEDLGPRRFSAPEDVERRLEQAAALDPSADDSVAKWARHHFATRAGRLTLANPSERTCAVGLDALADALHEAEMARVASACRAVPGDVGARAAFKLGLFRGGVGDETEAILSRLPFPPRAEPACFAGGATIPSQDTPICRLLHAEARPESRSEALSDLEVEPAYARRWLAAMRAARGEPLPEDVRFTVDPEALLFEPFAAIVDEPIAVYADLRSSRIDHLSPPDAVWVDLVLSAGASAFGDHGKARELLEDALVRLDVELAAPERDPRDHAALRTAVVIAVRAGDHALARAIAELLPPGDDLVVDAARLVPGEPLSPALLSRARLENLDGLGSPALASRLAEPSSRPLVLAGAGRLLDGSRDGAPLRDWVREAFPSCEECGFHEQLGLLLLRRDAAEALGATDVLKDLAPIVARFRAVFEHRPLALILRAGRG